MNKMNESVRMLQGVELKGNIIPHNWFNTIKKESGTVDYIAILVLSEIVYWYRPSYQFDDLGRVIGIKQRFAGDALQKSYEDLAAKLGATKRQVREAVVRLEKLGIIKREFRNITVKGAHLSNVLFIHLDVEKLKGVTFFSNTYDINKSEVSHLNVTPPTQKCQTYTKITTKITTKNTQRDLKDIADSGESASLEEAKDTESDVDWITKISKAKGDPVTGKIDPDALTKAEQVRFVYEYWNLQKVTVHRKKTDLMDRSIRRALKNIGIKETCRVIKNYAMVYKSPDHWFEHKYTLAEVLRPKDIDKFCEEAEPLAKFAKQKNRFDANSQARQKERMSKNEKDFDWRG